MYAGTVEVYKKCMDNKYYISGIIIGVATSDNSTDTPPRPEERVPIVLICRIYMSYMSIYIYILLNAVVAFA